MYCLDTNIFVDILRGDLKLIEKIEDLLNAGTPLFLSPISLCELCRGAYGHANAKEKLMQLNNLVSYFEILEFDVSTCHEFGRMHTLLKRSGKTASEFDLLIAVSAKVHDLILITRDNKGFEHTGVKLEVW